MNCEQAFKAVGYGASGVPFNNMVKALGMCSWINTAEENERLAAALWIKKNRKAYEAYCQAKRNGKGK
jgi:hypothetical protein